MKSFSAILKELSQRSESLVMEFEAGCAPVMVDGGRAMVRRGLLYTARLLTKIKRAVEDSKDEIKGKFI